MAGIEIEGLDKLQKTIAGLIKATGKTDGIAGKITNECEKIFANSATYSEALEALENLYPKMEFNELENALTKYLANSAILAAAEVEDAQKKQAKGGE